MAHLDDAEQVAAAAGAMHRLARVVLQRSEDVADRDLHRGCRFDALEDEQAEFFEAIVDLGAQAGVGEAVTGDTADAGAEVQIVADGFDRDRAHGRVVTVPARRRSSHDERALHRVPAAEDLDRVAHVVDVAERERAEPVTHKSLDGLGKLTRDLGRHREMLVLLLARE